jgi:hypothetical protein
MFPNGAGQVGRPKLDPGFSPSIVFFLRSPARFPCKRPRIYVAHNRRKNAKTILIGATFDCRVGRMRQARRLDALTGEKAVSGTIINLIMQLIAGAIGGNAVGAAAKEASLGTGGNTIAGALGGIAGGSLLTSLIPMLAGGANGVDIGAWVGQLVGGGVSGAIVAAIVGLIMNRMKSA